MVTKKLFNSREEWLQGRKNHIGGSDAAACVGLNPYKDNVQLWEEKVGLVLPEDISDKDYVQYGTEAEEYLRALFALDHPEYKVLYDPDNMFTNSKYPWMHASLDGELLDSTGRHGILEIKTTKLDNKQQKSIGIYNRSGSGPPNIALGGLEYTTYDTKQLSLLVHWNRDKPESEEAAYQLFEKLRSISSLDIGDTHIDYLRLMVPEPQDVGTDDNGMYEYVIWLDLIYQRK